MWPLYCSVIRLLCFDLLLVFAPLVYANLINFCVHETASLNDYSNKDISLPVYQKDTTYLTLTICRPAVKMPWCNFAVNKKRPALKPVVYKAEKSKGFCSSVSYNQQVTETACMRPFMLIIKKKSSRIVCLAVVTDPQRKLSRFP